LITPIHFSTKITKAAMRPIPITGDTGHAGAPTHSVPTQHTHLDHTSDHGDHAGKDRCS
jgi:hypothetical protein